MTANASTRIAIREGKTWTINDWEDIDFSQESGWQKAIGIFEDPIRGRFLDVIEKFECKDGTGFAVMALDCLLIETLQQFREGKAETPRSQSGEYFRRFLTQTSFKDYFDEAKAKIFYDQVRCGILHQAEVKGSSKIQTKEEQLLIAGDGKGGVNINRRKFHNMMEQVFQEYVGALRKNNPPDKPLRSNFKTKMDAICYRI